MGDAKGTDGLEDQLVEVKKWVAQQPHIPKDMDDKLLRRFLHSCYYDMGKTQKTIEAFSSMRATVPEVFSDRDPLSPRAQKAAKYINLAMLPISGNRMLWIFQLNDPGLQNYDYCEFTRAILMAIDAWFLHEHILQEGDVTLFDAKDISWKIFWKLNLSLQKKLVQYQEEALPIRIKQMHLINAPSFIDKLFSLLKQFMTKEMSDMFHFHPPKSDTVFEHFSRDELPKDFGGNLDSLETYNKKTIDLLLKHRLVPLLSKLQLDDGNHEELRELLEHIRHACSNFGIFYYNPEITNLVNWN